MFNNPYMTNAFNPQPSIDRINDQINQLENMKKQIQQPQPTPTNLTQNFQLAPTNREVIRYADSLDEVQRDMVIGDTPYFSRDMSVVWVKNLKGDIRTYELKEIVPLDEKDIKIQNLEDELERLKGVINYESSITKYDSANDETDTTEDDESTRSAVKESKSTGLSRISKGKTK